MKKAFGLFCVVAILLCAVQVARSLGVPPVPPGISANDWIPLGNEAGFVITHDLSPTSAPPKAGEVRGYFMVRPGNRWLRVDSQAELQQYPAKLSH
jgi:hypothetical protein